MKNQVPLDKSTIIQAEFSPSGLPRNLPWWNDLDAKPDRKK